MVGVDEDLLKSVVIRTPIYWLALRRGKAVCCGISILNH